jgi:hypothetical protein
MADQDPEESVYANHEKTPNFENLFFAASD